MFDARRRPALFNVRGTGSDCAGMPHPGQWRRNAIAHRWTWVLWYCPGVLNAGPSDKALTAVIQDRRRRDEGTKGMSGT